MTLCGSLWAAPEELVTNGGFEEGKAPWGPGITDQEAHTGKHSIKLDNSQGRGWAGIAYTKTIPLKPHVPYRISIWLKRQTGDGYVQIGGYPVDANGQKLVTGRSWTMVLFPIQIMTGQGLNEWTHFETVFTVHRSDFAGLIPRFVHRNGKDVLYFDDFSIQEAQLPPAPEHRFPDAVLYPGHPSRFHMRVEGAEQTPDGLRIVTTGAEYIFDEKNRRITCRQRIGVERQVVALACAQPLGALKVTQKDEDACVVQGDGLAFGVQGDSLISLATNRELDFTVASDIAPKHLATQGPHLLAVDDWGGFVISHDFSQKYGTAGCELSSLPDSMARPGWGFRYHVGPRERVGIAVFPPRPYDWKTAFEKRIVNVMGLISDDAIRFYRKYCSVLMLFDGGRLYQECRKPKPGRGPYVFLDPDGMRRTVKTAHGLGMQVITYCNTSGELDVWYGDNTDAAFDYVASVTRDYGIDGWYFDGVFTDNNWSRAYTWMRRIRDLVGPGGHLYTHCTLNSPLTRDDFYLPFIDAYNDFLLRGEGQAIKGVNDPYMRYIINSYRISNAIPTLKWDKMQGAETHDIFRAMLSFHGRFRWAYPTVPPKETTWRGTPPPDRAALDREFLDFYFPELDRQQALWREGKLDMDIHWPVAVEPTEKTPPAKDK
jgi:hypothetical protein